MKSKTAASNETSKYILIALGGFLGANFRYVIKGWELLVSPNGFPYNTLLINVLGSLLLAFVATISAEVLKRKEPISIGIMTGFLGAFTTFSTVCKEISRLLDMGNVLTAVLYGLLSVALGLIAVYIGIILGKLLITQRHNRL